MQQPTSTPALHPQLGKHLQVTALMLRVISGVAAASRAHSEACKTDAVSAAKSGAGDCNLTYNAFAFVYSIGRMLQLGDMAMLSHPARKFGLILPILRCAEFLP